MIKRFFIIILCVACSIGASAQILWKVSGNGIQKPSFIFGTHHVAPLSLLDSIKGFNDAIESCSQIYGEIDMADMAAVQAKAMQYVMAPKDSLLNAVISPEDFKIVGKAVSKYMKADINQMIMLKPAAISSVIAIAQAAETFSDFDISKQLDASIQERFKNRGINPKGLESAEFQLQMLYNAPIAEQVDDLIDLVKDEEKSKDMARNMASAYSAQDLNLIFKLLTDPELGMTGDKADRMIFNRNIDWVNKLQPIMKAEPTFVAVGVGHLPGDKGLIALLRNLGYSVTPVQSK